MEATEEVAGPLVKGKRTKRQRLLLPPAAPAASSTSSTEFSGSTTEEEEDMANCLILLAQGRALDDTQKPEAAAGDGGGGGGVKFTSRRFAEAATTTNGKAGFYVYECKTCSRCFPSFQALGGHRASHKKPKIAAVPGMSTHEDKRAVANEDGLDLSMNSFSKPFMAPASSSKPKVHECSICKSEFSSGQALGGHMRRHRPASISEPPDAKKERHVLSLDLNLPAPSEDDPCPSSAPAFTFSGKQPLVFSASALVDCHY